MANGSMLLSDGTRHVFLIKDITLGVALSLRLYFLKPHENLVLSLSDALLWPTLYATNLMGFNL